MKAYHASLLAALQDLEEAEAYLQAAIEEDDLPTLLLAVRTILEALARPLEGREADAWN